MERPANSGQEPMRCRSSPRRLRARSQTTSGPGRSRRAPARDSIARFLHVGAGVTHRVGLCGFTIGAAAYFEQFPVVEVQQTFYDPPPARTLERWRAQAPPAFEFTMKAWQVITHLGTSRTYRRLKSPFTDQQRAEAGAFRDTPTVMEAWNTTVACSRRLRRNGDSLSVSCELPRDRREHRRDAHLLRTSRPSVRRASAVGASRPVA
jgi:hypothetical protein